MCIIITILRFCNYTVRKKYGVASSVTLQYVTNSDGCIVDSEDLVDIVGCQETLMVLCGTDQKWSKVRHTLHSPLHQHIFEQKLAIPSKILCNYDLFNYLLIFLGCITMYKSIINIVYDNIGE